MTAPLTGLRVVDCSWGTAGPQATWLLADYGADVVWIEPPGGDPTRRHHPATVSVFGRGKRSVVRDLHDPAQRDDVLRLTEHADVFVESWRPGVATRLGLDPTALRARNPRLVTCSITGFGPDGPWRDVRGYESVVHALLGTMAAQPGHRPPPIYEGLPFASTGAAQLAVIGILAARLRGLDDGVGRHVETSLLDGAMAFHSMLWGESDASVAAGAGMIDMTRASGMRLVTRSFLCADGEYIGVHTGAVGAFGRLMEVLGLDDRIPPSETGIDMGVPLTPEQAELLEREIHPIFVSQTREYWVEHLMAADVCAVEHLHPTQVFDQPQTRHNEMVVEVDDPVLGRVEQVAAGIRFDGAAPPAPRAAPLPGEHTNEVLAELAGRPTPTVAASAPGATADTRPLLDGVRILDLGAYYAGPYTSRLLADLGADVIKLEPTFGDPLRGIERPFFSAQAGKRSLAANLKHPELAARGGEPDRGVRRRPPQHAPGSRRAPRTRPRPGGCGESRRGLPLRAGVGIERPAHAATELRADDVRLRRRVVRGSGSVQRAACRRSATKTRGTASSGAIATLIALLHRRTTGSALACENPQLNAAMGMVAHVVRRVSGGQPVGAERLDPVQFGVSPLDRLYATSDGWILVVAPSDDALGVLGKAIDHDLIGDARFSSVERREEHADALAAVLQPIFRGKDCGGLVDALEAVDVTAVVPVGPNVHEVMNDPEHRQGVGSPSPRIPRKATFASSTCSCG